jgi:hypothetical protein
LKETDKVCKEHTKNLHLMVKPKSMYECNELCVKDRDCEHFNHNSGTSQCEMQKKGYCSELIDAKGWKKYEPTEHLKVVSVGHGCKPFPEFGNDLH